MSEPSDYLQYQFKDFTQCLAEYVRLRQQFRRMKMELQCRGRLMSQLNAIISEHRKIVDRIIDTWETR